MKYFKEYIPKDSLSNKLYQIPKKIFMTWDSHELSDDMHNNIQLWIEKNPDWELYLYDEKQVLELIESNFDKNVADAYNNISPKAYKADLFRYCVLFIYGGVYSDVKIVPLQPISNILSKNIGFLSVKDRSLKGSEFDGYISQAFLCSKSKHPFFKRAIEMIVENSKNNYYGNDPLSPTGPNLLGKAINLCLDKHDCSEISLGKHTLNEFNFEILALKNHAIIDSNGEKLSLNAYKNYRKELYSTREISKNYSICWFNDKVYINNTKPRNKSKYYLKKKPLWIVEYFYFTRDVKRARIAVIKYCFLRPLLAQRIIKKIIGYERQNKK